MSTGLLFGGLMALILGSLHIWSVRRMPAGRSEGALSVHHVREVELRLSYDEAFDLCVSSLAAVRKCRILREDRSLGKIDARAGMTWKTWGDVVSLEVRRTSGDLTRVEISSRPALRTTLVDCGKNLENVESITGFLTRRVERAG